MNVPESWLRSFCNPRLSGREIAERLTMSGLEVEAYEPVGCARCGNSGYKGRIGLYEVMQLTEEIRSLCITRASADAIAEVAVGQGMKRLREDGLDKVRLGITSIAEVARVTGTGS